MGDLERILGCFTTFEPMAKRYILSLSLSCARSRALSVYTTIPLNLMAYDKRVQLNIRKTYKSWLELKISALFNHSLYPSKRMSAHS